MKSFKAEWTGFSNKQKMTSRDGNVGQEKEVVHKTMGVLGGDQTVKYYNGIKLWVSGPDETIIKGPELLIGQTWNKVVNVPFPIFMDLNQALSTIQRGTNVFNNINMSPEQRYAAKNAENIKIQFTKAIVDYNKSRYEKLAPGTTLPLNKI